jgi:hypothetical protein
LSSKKLIISLDVGYFLNTISWIFGFIIAGGIIVTGISADSGKAWAAGNRAYRPIDG